MASAEKEAAMAIPSYMHGLAVTPLLWSAVETCVRRKQEGDHRYSESVTPARRRGSATCVLRWFLMHWKMS